MPASIPGNDPILKQVIMQYGLPKIQFRQPGFASMVHIILEQQVSISSAKACYHKLTEALGDISPDRVLQASPELLRTCGVSRQKAGYILNMAEMVKSGGLNFDRLAALSPEEARLELLQIKGVGNWTAEVYLMFCLQSPDIIPIGDIAIQSAIRELYDVNSIDEMKALAETWSPQRTLASYILWQHYLGKRNRL